MMARLFLLLCLSSLLGCYAAAVPFLIHNDFHEKRVALKTDWQKERVSKDSAKESCLSMLRKPDGKHAAPPPFPDDVCDFGSFGDNRYELTVLVEQGSLSEESFRRECLAFQPRPAGADCTYDPIGESIQTWKSVIARGFTTKEAVQYDCERLVKEKSKGSRQKDNVCAF